jgi:hypothetical protein
MTKAKTITIGSLRIAGGVGWSSQPAMWSFGFQINAHGLSLDLLGVWFDVILVLMLVFDFFAGTGSATQAFVDAGDTVVTFEMDRYFNATETVDITTLTAEYLLATYGQPDFIWASPPCTAFSVASIGHHWGGGKGAYEPKTEAAVHNQYLVTYTRDLITELSPRSGWIIENPRGVLRKLPPVQELPHRTVTYCQYGDNRMKPTDLWGDVPNWTPLPMCKNGSPCHEAAPRGARTGTQGLKDAKLRSMVLYQLGLEIRNAIVGKGNNE